MNKLVTIVIPAYNAGDFIEQTLDSAVHQDYDSIEIIVVDDGSTDDTVEIVQSFGDAVTLIQNEHQGGAIARNTAIKASRGHYMSFLDADDMLMPSSVSSRVDALENNPDKQLVFGCQQYFYDDNMDEKLRAKLEAQYGDKVVPAEIIGTLLLTREDFLRVGYFNADRTIHDFLGWYGIAKDHGLKSIMLDEVVLKRRIHDTNFSRTYSNQRLASSLKYLLDHRRQQAKKSDG